MKTLLKTPLTENIRGRDTRAFRGYLAETYDGIGQYILVSLSRASVAAAVRARICAGDFGTKTLFPEGTPVVVFSSHGRLEVLSLGTKTFNEITEPGGPSTFPPENPIPPDPPEPPPDGEFFAAPVTTSTFDIPDTIDFTGSDDVSAEMNAFIESVPDGSTINSAIEGSIYRMASGGALFQQRNNLIFDGNGWTTVLIEGDGGDEANSAFLMRASNHIWIDGFYVTGDGVSVTNGHESEGERAHVLGVSGFFALGPSSYITMSNVTADHIKGDGVYIEGSNDNASFPESTYVWVYNSDFDHMGRNGVSFINCTNVLIESCTFNHSSYHVFDFEANFANEFIGAITVRNNSVGSYSHRGGLLGYFVADVPLGAGSITSGILIQNNTVIGTSSNGYDGSPRGLDSKFIGDGYPPNGITRHSNIQFLDNSTSQTRSGPVIYGYRIDNLTVTGNTQPLSSGTLVSTGGASTGVIDSPNP